MNTIRLKCGCLWQGPDLEIVQDGGHQIVDGTVTNMVMCSDAHAPRMFRACHQPVVAAGILKDIP